MAYTPLKLEFKTTAKLYPNTRADVDQRKGTLFFQPCDIERHVIGINSNHQLCFPKGELLDGVYKVVVDKENQLIGCLKEKNGKKIRVGDKTASMKHSTLTLGKEVIFSGIIKCENGKIVAISNESGHYKIKPDTFEEFCKALQEKGLISESILKTCFLPLTENVIRIHFERIKEFGLLNHIHSLQPIFCRI